MFFRYYYGFTEAYISVLFFFVSFVVFLGFVLKLEMYLGDFIKFKWCFGVGVGG